MVGVRTWTDDGIWFVLLASNINKPDTLTSGRNSKLTRRYTDEQIAFLCKQNVEDLKHTPDASGIRYVRSNKKQDAPPPSPAVLAAIERLRRQPDTLLPNQELRSGNGGMAGNTARNGSNSTRDINIQQGNGSASSAIAAPIARTKAQIGMPSHFGDLRAKATDYRPALTAGSTYSSPFNAMNGVNPRYQQRPIKQQRFHSLQHRNMNGMSSAQGYEMSSNSSSFQSKMRGFNNGISGSPAWSTDHMGYPQNPPGMMAPGGQTNNAASTKTFQAIPYGQSQQPQSGQNGRPISYGQQNYQGLDPQLRSPHIAGHWRSQQFTSAVSNPQPEAQYMNGSWRSQQPTDVYSNLQSEVPQTTVQWAPQYLALAASDPPFSHDFNGMPTAQSTFSGIPQTTFQNSRFNYTNPHDNQLRSYHSETQGYSQMPNNLVNPEVNSVQPNFMSQKPHSSIQNTRKHQRDLDEYWKPSMDSNENFERDIKRHRGAGIAGLGQMDHYRQEENNDQASLQQRPSTQELHTRAPDVSSTTPAQTPASEISPVNQSRVTLSNTSAPDGEGQSEDEFMHMYNAEFLPPFDAHSSSQHNDEFNTLDDAEFSQDSTLFGEEQSQLMENLFSSPNFSSFDEFTYDQFFTAIDDDNFLSDLGESLETQEQPPRDHESSATDGAVVQSIDEPLDEQLNETSEQKNSSEDTSGQQGSGTRQYNLGDDSGLGDSPENEGLGQFGPHMPNQIDINFSDI
ncbi:hypothetical protein EYC84_004773 [Monilinia fructicola]|uniref:Uncharacterized protein n=1 Tax=Monilinia fructicola TaxID=38448 RepID=A0A5M9K9T3_MONFR|nr:hypothetical protein EYC84_004773 [Monilinia fructicola]